MSEDDAARLAKKWMEKTGYPLEMRVLAAFQKQGVLAEGSRYIVAEDGSLRELDVHATIHGRRNVNEPAVILSVVIECKAAPTGQPWIVLVDGQARMSGDNDVYDAMEKDIWKLPNDAASRAFDCPLLFWQGPVGYNVVEAKGEGGQEDRNDRAYKAVRQLTAGVDGLMRDRATDAVAFLRVFVPVIVTDAPIVLCSLDENAEPTFERVDQALWVTRPRAKATPSAIWLWSADSLPRLVKAAQRSADSLRPASH